MKTGVVGLRGLGLDELPEDAFGGAPPPPQRGPAAVEEAASKLPTVTPPPPISPSPLSPAPAVPPTESLTSPPPLLALARAADLSHNRLGRLPPTLLAQV